MNQMPSRIGLQFSLSGAAARSIICAMQKLVNIHDTCTDLKLFVSRILAIIKPIKGYHQTYDMIKPGKHGDKEYACSSDLPGRVVKGDRGRGSLLGPEAKNRSVIAFVTHTRSLNSQQPPPSSNSDGW